MYTIEPNMTHLKAIERIISLCPRLFYRESVVIRYLDTAQVLVFLNEEDRLNFFKQVAPEWIAKFSNYVDYRLKVDISAFSKKGIIEQLLKTIGEDKILTPKNCWNILKNDKQEQS
jgi:hypothetical protein